MRAVVLCAAGTVGGAGTGLEPLARALRDATPSTSPMEWAPAGLHRGSRTASLARGHDLSAWLSPRLARRMTPPSRFAVAAAHMARQSACIPAEAGPEEERTAVCLSTGFGPNTATEEILGQMRDGGPETVSPFLFTESVANAPAAQIALALRTRGANYTIMQREAGPLLAVRRGAREIAAGRAERVLVGSVDEVTSHQHAILDRFGALSRGGAGAPEAARPFDRERDGFLLAEGATVIVLEEERQALSRGAPTVARIAAAGAAHDDSARCTDWGNGVETLAAALQATLRRAGVRPGDVDRIVSGASGSRRGDRLEARVLRTVWKGDLPPVLAPKSVTGEYGGGFLAAAVLATGDGPFGPTAGFRQADPELGVVPHDGSALPPARWTVVTAIGSGGTAAWVVLERG